MSVLNLIRKELKEINGYQPEIEAFDCRLHANELPWSPIEALNLSLNHYPASNLQTKLEQQLADYYCINRQQLTLTRGSDEGIDLLMRLFLVPGSDSIMQCPPTFPMYTFFAQLQHAQVINCPLKAEDNFKVPTEQIIRQWQPGCKLVLICQPNNPTGTVCDLLTIASLCESFTNKAVVVVDEAYIDFSSTPSAISLLNNYDNLIILRTLSKAFGLASLRLGAIISNEALINQLRNIISPYHVPSPCLHLANEALSRWEWFKEKIDQIISERQRLKSALEQITCIKKVYESQANFLLVESPVATELAAWLKSHKIAVKTFPASSLVPSCLRITIGTAVQNDVLLQKLCSFGESYEKNTVY